MVHNGGSPNFNRLLFDKKTDYLAQILQSLSYKVCSIILPKFTTFGLLIPILGTSAIMDQRACCYNVTTSEIGLYYHLRLSLLRQLGFPLFLTFIKTNVKIDIYSFVLVKVSNWDLKRELD